jgi:hypothetical protein
MRLRRCSFPAHLHDCILGDGFDGGRGATYAHPRWADAKPRGQWAALCGGSIWISYQPRLNSAQEETP